MHRIASKAVGAALLALAVSLPVVASSAHAGDGAPQAGGAPPAGAPLAPAAPSVGAPATEPSLRQTAVDSAIHQLERHLTALRKTRNDLRAGRAESAPSDDDRRQRDLDARAMREVARYEGARAKALAAVATAAAAADAAKATEAQAAVEAADKRFVDAMKKIEDDREAKHSAKADGRGDAKPDGKGSDTNGDGKIDAKDAKGDSASESKPRRKGHPPTPAPDDED